MPSVPWGPYQNDLAQGLFGSFQAAAAAHEGTAEVWQRLREAVGSWEWTTSGRGGTPTADELRATGAELLSANGVDALTVGAYRKVAGEWLAARERLSTLGPESQIDSRAIFRPPWAETGSAGVPEQYRARVQWQITPTSGEPFTKWSTYALTSPLLGIGDTIDQATAAMESDAYLMLLSGGAPPTAENLEVELI